MHACVRLRVCALVCVRACARARIYACMMWSHEAEHREGGNGIEGGEINMAAVHGRTVQKGPKRNGLLQRNITSEGWRGEAVKVMTGLCNCIWKRKE